MNSCIHSDSNAYSGGNTVWYNYVLASADTIKNKDETDTTGNINTATESICPRGWTLPTVKQIDSNRSASAFSLILGGGYNNGVLEVEEKYGFWWGSTASNGARRYFLLSYGSSLSTNNNSRHVGRYIRCVSEEKTVLDLTYMQDMTPAISSLLPLPRL